MLVKMGKYVGFRLYRRSYNYSPPRNTPDDKKGVFERGRGSRLGGRGGRECFKVSPLGPRSSDLNYQSVSGLRPVARAA